MVVATPVWVRMPIPTTEILATSASWVTDVAPTSLPASSAARRVSGRSPLATVKLTSVIPPVETFWTIMSTTMFAAAIVRKMAWTTPGRSGTPRIVIRASSLASAAPVTGTPSRRASCSPTIQVPGASENELRTWIGTPYFLANSIDRECITPAPRLASSSISS